MFVGIYVFVPTLCPRPASLARCLCLAVYGVPHRRPLQTHLPPSHSPVSSSSSSSSQLALNTRDPKILRRIMKVLTRMVTMCDMVGEAMVPYFRQLLPVLNIFKDDKEVFGKRNETCLGELVYETLTTFETYGGPDAFVNIKYMIPTYESCLS